MGISISDNLSGGMLAPRLIKNGIYDIQFLDQGHFPKVLELQEIIAIHLPNRETYRIDSPEYIAKHFSGEYNIIGAFDQGKLVAYHVVSFPGLTKENFGLDITLDSYQLERTAHFETTAVHPLHRGNQLLRKMAIIHLEFLQSCNYEHILCTVSPSNYFSLVNVFQMGFVIRALKEKHYGLRYTMYKNLKQTVAINKQRTITVKNTEPAAQQELLAQGYYGFSINKASDGLEILYGRAKGVRCGSEK